MRIIAGTARSLPLKTVPGRQTRPTTDQIKETLFNILQPYVPGAYFLDLFAGSGQIGLEAVSRGALYSVFVENQKKAAQCIADNIRFTKFDKKSLLMQTDVFAAIGSLEGKYKFDLIFMDPPYNQGLDEQVFERLQGSPLLKEDTLIVAEVSTPEFEDYLGEYGFEIVKFKQYRNKAHIFVRQKEA